MLPLPLEARERLLLRGVGWGPTYCSDGAEAGRSGSMGSSLTCRLGAGCFADGTGLPDEVLACFLRSETLAVGILPLLVYDKDFDRFLDAAVVLSQMWVFPCFSASLKARRKKGADGSFVQLMNGLN